MKILTPKQQEILNKKEAIALDKKMTNYIPTKYEFSIMSECLRMGYRCYPSVVNQGKSPSFVMILEPKNGKPISSTKEPMSQKYLTYETIQLYLKIWDRIKFELI